MENHRLNHQIEVPLKVQEIDGSPSVQPVNTIKVTNGTLTDNGDGSVTISVGGAGTPGGSDTQVQFNDGGSFGGDAGLTYNKTTNALTAGDVLVDDEAYGAGWNASLEVPTKNAVYDKIETITAGSGISEELAIAYSVSL